MATRKPSVQPEAPPALAPEAPPPPAPEAAPAPAPDVVSASAPEAAPPEAPAPEAVKVEAPDPIKDAIAQHREVVVQIRNHPLGIDARQISFALNVPIQQIHQAINALEAVGLIRRSNLVGFQIVAMTPMGALETGRL